MLLNGLGTSEGVDCMRPDVKYLLLGTYLSEKIE